MIFNVENYSHEKKLKPEDCYLHRVTIVRHAKSSHSWPREIVCQWNLPFDVFLKWKWYIQYRWALAKVATPKQLVEVNVWWYEKQDSEEILKKAQEKKANDAIKGKKSQITMIENRMAQAKAEWNSFLPIEEDVLWKNAMAKLEQKKCELRELLKSTNQ